MPLNRLPRSQPGQPTRSCTCSRLCQSFKSASSAGSISTHKASAALPPFTSGERLEGDQGEGVLHAGHGLDLRRYEVTDVDLLVEIAFHQEVILAGGRIDLRHLLDAHRL